jgi:23S rRNA (uracil1939-C5)-methyltransferase
VTETFDLRIDSIAAGGDGVGRRKGLVVFVPRAAPGDLARVRAEQDGRLMRGRLLEVLSPSPQRIEPPCAHYVIDRCGGCQIQHLLYDAQVAAISVIIRDALARIGRLEINTPNVEPSSKPWRYRQKLTLALRQRDERWIGGLHRYDTPEEVFELRDCPITDEAVMRAWSLVLAQEHLLPRSMQLRAAVRLLSQGFSFTLEGQRTWPKHGEFFAAIPSLVELWWKPEGQARRLLLTRAEAQRAGASFIQVNPAVAAKVRDWVMSLAAAMQPRTAIDAYAGTGDLAVALANQGARVTAIEIDRDAARVCESRLPEGSRAIAAPVEEALGKALPADLVILNPPRAGLDPRVAEMLKPRAESGEPRAIIYISCNPATLARDLRRMGSYRVRSVCGFDMFPQTAHVETVCELVPST